MFHVDLSNNNAQTYINNNFKTRYIYLPFLPHIYIFNDLFTFINAVCGVREDDISRWRHTSV